MECYIVRLSLRLHLQGSYQHVILFSECPFPVHIHSDGTEYCFFYFSDTTVARQSEAEDLCTRMDPDASLPILDTAAKINHMQSISDMLFSGFV